MSLLRMILPVFLASSLSVASTFIVKRDGVEIGRYTQNDGNDGVRVMKSKVAQRASPGTSEKTKEKAAAVAGRSPDAGPTIYQERRFAELGIFKGMTRAEVERLAASHDVSLHRKYMHTIPDQRFGSGRTRTTQSWVYEYRFRTETLAHVKKVYFDIKWVVIDIASQSRPLKKWE